MSKKIDLLVKLKQQKKNIRFSELEHILMDLGYKLRSTKGSHHIYSKEKCLPIMLVKPHGTKKFCHPYDVIKIIRILEKINE